MIRLMTAFLALTLFAGQAFAQAYPSKPIRIIVPFAAGGINDTLARLLSPHLQEDLGQPIVVEVKTGANGNIATNYVAKSDPDGYTILVFSASYLINPSTYKSLPFDTLKDLTLICMVAQNNNVIVTSPKLGAKDFKQLIQMAKERPGGLNYGSSGVGGALHLAAEMIAEKAGIKMVHVPYSGTGAVMPALIANNVDLAVASIPSAMAMIKSNQVKALAVTGPARAATLPDVPTLREMGIPLETVIPVGLAAPAGTPQAIIERLAASVHKALAADDIRKRLTSLEVEPFFKSPADATAYVKAEIERYAGVVKSSGVVPQ